MAKDDYFKIVYIILSELYESLKQGEKADIQAISPERLCIYSSYMIDILEELLSNGYIKGIIIKQSKTGRFILNLKDIKITMKGVEYLKDNSMMNKVANALKTIKDIAPRI